jgi:hypothetical protein
MISNDAALIARTQPLSMPPVFLIKIGPLLNPDPEVA